MSRRQQPQARVEVVNQQIVFEMGERVEGVVRVDRKVIAGGALLICAVWKMGLRAQGGVVASMVDVPKGESGEGEFPFELDLPRGPLSSWTTTPALGWGVLAVVVRKKSLIERMRVEGVGSVTVAEVLEAGEDVGGRTIILAGDRGQEEILWRDPEVEPFLVGRARYPAHLGIAWLFLGAAVGNPAVGGLGAGAATMFLSLLAFLIFKPRLSFVEPPVRVEGVEGSHRRGEPIEGRIVVEGRTAGAINRIEVELELAGFGRMSGGGVHISRNTVIPAEGKLRFEQGRATYDFSVTIPPDEPANLRFDGAELRWMVRCKGIGNPLLSFMATFPVEVVPNCPTAVPAGEIEAMFVEKREKMLAIRDGF